MTGGDMGTGELVGLGVGVLAFGALVAAGLNVIRKRAKAGPDHKKEPKETKKSKKAASSPAGATLVTRVKPPLKSYDPNTMNKTQLMKALTEHNAWPVGGCHRPKLTDLQTIFSSAVTGAEIEAETEAETISKLGAVSHNLDRSMEVQGRAAI